ncbi:MAG TPA: winged helix-turn-helix domain-containing protein [Ktedonobacterales bacterium]
MDARTEARATAPRAVDLRRGRAPEIEIVDCATYDFLLSLHVTLVASQTTLHEFDIGADWVAQARARCDAHDPQALDTLGRYLGDMRSSSLQATLISLISQCPAPNDPPHFLDWLTTLPAADFAEALLDQEGLSAEWPSLLRAALEERSGSDAAPEPGPGPAAQRLLADYPRDARPMAQRVLMDVEGVRVELIGALRVWYTTVFADEEEQLAPLLRREAAAMERRRTEMPLDSFIEREMRGVQWQRPAGLRRFIFAPSFFCRPAVFYHFWRGTLTFCAPTTQAAPSVEQQRADPNAPSEETLRFFEALGDDTRLRILRLLAQREMYLTELAERLGLTKATTKHHMVRLRATGMVTLYDRERMTYYALRPDVPRRAAQALENFLHPDAHR